VKQMRKRGSVVIEAVITFSLFLMTLIILIGTLMTIVVDEKLDWAAMRTKDELAFSLMPFKGHSSHLINSIENHLLTQMAQIITDDKVSELGMTSMVKGLEQSRLRANAHGIAELTLHYEYAFLSLKKESFLILPVAPLVISDGITFDDDLVYITNYGEKYHLSKCHHLRKSKYGIKIDEAKAKGYEPCKNCHGGANESNW